jgi:outer membrane protein assembly factor BamA
LLRKIRNWSKGIFNKRHIVFISALIFLLFSVSIFSQQAKKYELKSIRFEGNISFSATQLQLVIYTPEPPFWIWKFLNTFSSLGKEAVYFDSTMMKIDIQALTEFYMANGFFDSKVTPFYNLDTSSRTADLSYKIDEGISSNFGNINLIGLISIPGHTYKNIIENLSIDSTKRFSQGMVQQDIEKIVTNLQNNGYRNALFDSAIVFKDTMRKRADLNIYFSPGNIYSISDVIVKTKAVNGATIEDTLIKQLVDIKKGDLYSLEKIRRGQIRLFRTGIFTVVTVAGTAGDSVKNMIPVEVNGTIGKMNELSPEFLVNDQHHEFNVGLGASYTRKNFLGRARKFTASGSFGIQDIFRSNINQLITNFSIYDFSSLGYADARINIEQPFLFNEPIVGILETYGTVSKTDYLNVTKYGGKLSFEFEMPQYTFANYLSAYYNLEINNEYRLGVDSVVRKTWNLSIIGADIKSLKSNDPVFPSGGNNSSFLIEEANLLTYLTAKLAGREYTGAMFYKFLGTTAFYFPVSSIKNSVWGVKLKSGYIHAYKGSINEIPSDRKFFVGGSNSLRGWTAMDKSINPIANEETVADTGSGGTFLLEGSAEFRIRYMDFFGTTAFLDWGRSWVDYSKFRLDDIAINIGVGFRYYTSFAPFRLDLGLKLYDPVSPEGKSRWLFDKSFNKSFWDCIQLQFGIGEAF